MAFAFLAFGLWLRLGRLGQTRLRAALFVPISLVIWLAHTFGWGTLGVLAFSAETGPPARPRRGWLRAGFAPRLHCLSLAPPLLLMLIWRSGDVRRRDRRLVQLAAPRSTGSSCALRDRWQWFDVGRSVCVLGSARLARSAAARLGFSRNLAASALFLLVVYLLLPRIIFGSAYADMRLVPYLSRSA